MANKDYLHDCKAVSKRFWFVFEESEIDGTTRSRIGSKFYSKAQTYYRFPVLYSPSFSSINWLFTQHHVLEIGISVRLILSASPSTSRSKDAMTLNLQKSPTLMCRLRRLESAGWR